MNFRPHQICLSCTDDDNAVLQQETETIHVSDFQLLHSQPVGLGLLVELLTRAVERSAVILADVRNFAFDTFESSAVASLRKLLLWFSRHYSYHSMT